MPSLPKALSLSVRQQSVFPARSSRPLPIPYKMFIKYKLEVQIQTNSAFLEEEICLLEEKVVD